MRQDHYQVLGINKNATSEEIKKAYREKAMQWHPDKNPGNAVAEERFKEAALAYEVLSDSNRKSKYDAGENIEIDLSDVFSSVFRGSYNTGKGFSPFDVDLSSLFDAVYGDVRAYKHLDIGVEIMISLEEAYLGTNRELQFSENEIVNIAIPRGISNGKRLRYPNLGKKGRIKNGDLYVTFLISQHDKYTVSGLDIHSVEDIDIYTAIFGGQIEIKTLEKTLKITVPSNSETGKRLSIQGQGMPAYNSTNFFGNHIIFLNVKIPNLQTMSIEERNLLLDAQKIHFKYKK